MGETKPRTIHARMMDLRDRICALDWSDDGMYQQGGRPIRYLSSDKIKENLMPVFSAVGIDLTPEFFDLTKHEGSGALSQHWTVRLKVTLTDVDTGEQDISFSYGEGMDNLDKGVTKALGNAFKNWVTAKFQIADLTPETEEGMPSGTYRPRSEEEQTAAKSAILNQNIAKPKTDSPKPNFVVPPTKITNSRPPEVVQVTMDNVPKDEAPAEKPAEAPAKEPTKEPVKKAAKTTAFKIPEIYKQPVQKVLDNRAEMLKSGAITQAQYDEVMNDHAAFKDAKDVMEFLKKHKVLA